MPQRRFFGWRGFGVKGRGGNFRVSGTGALQSLCLSCTAACRLPVHSSASNYGAQSNRSIRMMHRILIELTCLS